MGPDSSSQLVKLMEFSTLQGKTVVMGASGPLQARAVLGDGYREPGSGPGQPGLLLQDPTTNSLLEQ